MRTAFLILLSALAPFAYTRTTPDAHPLSIQVIASHLDSQAQVINGNSSVPKQLLHISAIIDGRHYEMVSEKTKQDKKTKQELLVLGTYKASLVSDEHSKPYRSFKVYEIQYPDGEIEQFTVVGEAIP